MKPIKPYGNDFIEEVEGGDIVVCKDGYSYLTDDSGDYTRFSDGEVFNNDELQVVKNCGKVKEIICER